MTRACHTAVRMATGRAFTDAEIDDLLDRMGERAKRARLEAPTATAREALSLAAQDLTKAELKEALIQRRMEAAAAVARQARRTRLAAMPEAMSPAQKLNAYNVGSERQGRFTSSSVDAEGRARQMGLWGDVERGFAKMPGLMDRLSNWLGVTNKPFARLVAREMARLNGGEGIEPTGDESALHAAQVLVSALEGARAMQNDVGAWIDKLPGYIARQSHDPEKVSGGMWRELGQVARRAKAGDGLASLDWAQARAEASKRAFGAWRDFIMPRLDPKTFAGLELEDVHFTKWEDETQEARQLNRRDQLEQARDLASRGVIKDPTDVRELMLFHVWMDIVTGRHEELSGANDLGDFRPPPSKARAVSAERVLHFTDPDAWMDYNEKFGRGGLLNTAMNQLERAGRNTALMQRWGPAPEAAFDAEKGRLAAEARARGSDHDVRQLGNMMTQANFEQLTGRAEAADNLRLAQVMRGLRGWEQLTKLGSITLSKATDLPMAGHTMARAGAGFLRGYGGFLEGITHLGSEDAKRAADCLDVGARSFSGHMGSQFTASDGSPGWLTWGTRMMYKLNAFEWLNNGARKGGAQVYSRFLGQEAEHGWDDLNAGTRETFERFGIGPADWEVARQGLEPAPDGRTYFTLDHLERTGAAGEVRLRFATMIHNVLDDLVSEPRAREKVGMTRGTRAGTVWGEIARSFFQFKGFINTIVGRHLVPTFSGYAGYSPVALVSHFLIASTLAGYVSMNAKLIARGQMPRSPVGADAGETAKIWLAALAQGGGLGLYGDFLFGEQNRNGGDFDWGSLGGPLLSDSEQVAKVVMQAVHGGAVSSRTGRSQIPGELVKIGSQNIPLVNLWYTRLALDYTLLWGLQERVSPGYLQRYEERVKSQQGSSFIVPPTAAMGQN